MKVESKAMISSTLLLLEMKLGLPNKRSLNSSVTPFYPRQNYQNYNFYKKRIMISFFWEHKDIILIEYVAQSKKVLRDYGKIV